MITMCKSQTAQTTVVQSLQQDGLWMIPQSFPGSVISLRPEKGAERLNRNMSDMKSTRGLLHVVLQELQGDSGLGLWSVGPLVEEYPQLKVMCPHHS